MTEQRLQGASFPIAIILLAVALYMLVGDITMDVPGTAENPGPKFFPRIIMSSAFMISAVMFVQGTRQLLRERQSEPALNVKASEFNWKLIGTVVATFVLFILLLLPLGWLLSAALLFFGVARGLGSLNMFNNAVIGLTISAVIQLVFSGLLGINLPTGILGGF